MGRTWGGPDKTERRTKELRTALMAIDRVMGCPLSEIAKKYRVSPGTVAESLSLAAESGFIDHFRKLAFDNLASKVMAVYEAHLEQGSLEAARDLGYGLGILQKDSQAAHLKGKVMDSLEAYRTERERRQTPPRPTATAAPPEEVH